MLPIVTPEEMRAIDAAAPEPVEELIERAGRRLARTARRMLGGVYGRRVVAVAGPGNNGADARIAVAVLARAGVRCRVVAPGDPLPACDLVIDGAFGTGISRPYVAPPAPHGARVLAVDIPSGVHGATGELVGQPLVADHTLTFAALKPGLLLAPGCHATGHIEIADIGLDTTRASAWLYTAHDARRDMPRRAETAHKWQQAVRVVGGSPGMSGAPRLAASAAMRSGAGLVSCVLPGGAVPTDRNEVIFRCPSSSEWAAMVLDDLQRYGALVVGPGLGRSTQTAENLQRLLAGVDLPLLLDGDALHQLPTDFAASPTQTVVLTPHDGEFEALCGRRPDADRFASVRAVARDRNSVVLLKGPLTIVAAPDGRVMAIGHGDQRLATAGSGDVLAGVIGALLAAGVSAFRAASLGAWLHADAAQGQPVAGMIASDLLAGLAQSISLLLAD